MTTIATLLIAIFLQQGYWLGGQTQTTRLAWAIEQPPAEAERAALAWRLMLAEVELARGSQPLGPGPEPAVVQLEAPQVRVPVRMRWLYEVTADGEPIAAGEESVHVCPDTLLAGLEKRLAPRELLVWNAPEGIAALLERAGVAHRRLADLEQLSFTDARQDVAADADTGAPGRLRFSRQLQVPPRFPGRGGTGPTGGSAPRLFRGEKP